MTKKIYTQVGGDVWDKAWDQANEAITTNSSNKIWTKIWRDVRNRVFWDALDALDQIMVAIEIDKLVGRYSETMVENHISEGVRQVWALVEHTGVCDQIIYRVMHGTEVVGRLGRQRAISATLYGNLATQG